MLLQACRLGLRGVGFRGVGLGFSLAVGACRDERGSGISGQKKVLEVGLGFLYP